MIGFYTLQDLMDARGPVNFHFGHLGRAEAKVQALVAGRNVTAGRGRESLLTVDLHSRTQAVAVAARSAQGDGKPVSRSAVIHKHQRVSAQGSNENVNPAIVV